MHLAVSIRFIGQVLLFGAAAYAVLSVLALFVRRRTGRSAKPDERLSSPITVLKPLCGEEPRLYENLRSFCMQDYQEFQLLFGLRDADDPALAVARRLQAEFPDRDIAVVVDARVHGINLKVSNLVNLLPHARHAVLVLADSDIEVAPDYLRLVTAPLAQPDVGVVTCLYRGKALGGAWSRLGAQFINDWFLPSVSLVRLFGSTRYSFGATIALRRETLAAIGGFESLSNIVADDWWLGEFARQVGLRTVLSGHEVWTDVVEVRFTDLIARELRWLRTIRSIDPLGYAFTFVCFTFPIVFAGLALGGATAAALGLAASAIGARLVLHCDAWSRARSPRTPLDFLKNFLLFPIRDCLSLLLWAYALGGGRVHWRGQQMKIDTQAAARISA